MSGEVKMARGGGEFCLNPIGCCWEQSCCSAFQPSLHAIEGMWFGSDPACRDVYAKLKICGFPFLYIISCVSWIWLPHQTRTTRVPGRKVPTFSLHCIQGSVCQIRKQLSRVFLRVLRTFHLLTVVSVQLTKLRTVAKLEEKTPLSEDVYEYFCPVILEDLWLKRKTSLCFSTIHQKINISK